MLVAEEAIARVLDAVVTATRLVRALQVEMRERGPVAAVSKSDDSPVTAADLAAQAILARGLQAAYGRVDIVGEESVDILADDATESLGDAVVAAVHRVEPTWSPEEILEAIASCDHRPRGGSYWTIDPIDGTRGFIAGRHCAVAVAFIEDGTPLHAFIGCPRLSVDGSDLYGEGLVVHASRGEGAWLVPLDEPSARPLALRRTECGESARPPLLCQSGVAVPGKMHSLDRIAAMVGANPTRLRIDGQAKYVVIGDGRADAYVRLPRTAGRGEWAWDHAAGALVAEEAGAAVSDVDGKPLDFSRGRRLSRNRGVVCAAPGLLERILEAIGRLDVGD